MWPFKGMCDESSWPDVDQNTVCGDCKVICFLFVVVFWSLYSLEKNYFLWNPKEKSFLVEPLEITLQVLVTHMNSVYHSCSNYCSSLGRACTGAWEEDHDSCGILSTEDCDHDFGSYTSDAICECGSSIWLCREIDSLKVVSRCIAMSQILRRVEEKRKR